MKKKQKHGENSAPVKPQQPTPEPPAEEIGGVKGSDPTRYGDWQHKGRVSDF